MATIKKDFNASSLPVAFSRGISAPIDKSLVWYSLEELKAYATSDPTAYVGQIVSLVDETANTSTAYIIADAAGNLQEVGSATLGDEKTITLNEDNGVLSLKNWGVQYYRWEEGEEEGQGQHVLQVVDDDHPWITGLEPKVVNTGSGFELAWYQPSSTTIEGVSSIVNSVQTSVTNLTNAIGTADDPAGTNTVYGAIAQVEADNEANSTAIENIKVSYLPLSGGTLTGELTLADGGKAISGTAVDTKIANAIGSAGHLKRAIVSQLPEVDQADADTIYMIKDSSILSGDSYKEYMLIDGAFAQIGDTTVDLSSYATTEAMNAAVAAVQTNLDAHAADTILHITADERTKWEEAAAKAAENEAAIGALVTVSQDDADKLAALPAIKAIGDNLELSDDGTLKAVAEQYVLPAATENALGGIMVGTGLSIDESGVLSVPVKVENGLSIGDEGITLALATQTSAGAMSADLFVKLTNLPENADANLIESIALGEAEQTVEITERKVILPYATAAIAGLVKSSEEDNTIKVDESGIMRLNRVSTSNLFVPDGEEFIISGGNA